MKKEEFLAEANRLLTKDPMSRVTPKVKEALESTAGCIFDTHCHIFDKHCINEKFFLLRFLMEAVGLENNDAVDARQYTPNALKMQGYQLLSKTEDQIYQDMEEGEDYDWAAIEEEVNSVTADSAALEGFSIGGMWRTLKNIVFKPHMRNILDYYLKNMAIKNLPAYSGRPFITSILLMDLETGWGKKIDKTLMQQIDEVKELAKEYPLLPFVAIDPRRADSTQTDSNLYRIVLHALTNGTPFFGIKVYPSLGYLPNDERLQPIFEVCEKFNIPVLTHCGGNVISTFKNPITVRDGSNLVEIKGNDRKEVAYKLNDPVNWKPVLERFPDLKLNFGHFGSDTVWEIYPKEDVQKRFMTITGFMQTYKNVYADFSFNIIDNRTFDTLKEVLDTNETVRARTLFGTDFWVVMPSGNFVRAQEEFNNTLGQHMELLLSANPRKYLFSH